MYHLILWAMSREDAIAKAKDALGPYILYVAFRDRTYGNEYHLYVGNTTSTDGVEFRHALNKWMTADTDLSYWNPLIPTVIE